MIDKSNLTTIPQNIPSKLITHNSHNKILNENQKVPNLLDSTISKEVIDEMKKQITKMENIVIDLLKNKKIPRSDINLLNKNYPDLKKVLDKYINKSNYLKNQIILLKSDSEVKEFINKEIQNLKLSEEFKLLPDFQLKLNLILFKSSSDFYNVFNEKIKKLEVIIIKLLNEKHLSSDENLFLNNKFPLVNKYLTSILDALNENIIENFKVVLTDEVNNLDFKHQNKLINNFDFKVSKTILDIIKNEILKVRNNNFDSSKIIRQIFLGEKLSLKNQILVLKKYPDLKTQLEFFKLEFQNIKTILNRCNSNNERESIWINSMRDIKENDFSINNLLLKKECIEVLKILDSNKCDINFVIYFSPYFIPLNLLYRNQISISFIFTIILIFIILNSFLL